MPHPTYHDIGDHTESIQVDFDPAKITYEKVLAVFWESHEPTHRAWSCQYRAAIFFACPEQERLAKKTRDALAAKLGQPVETAIEPLGVFTLAEDYHQKYDLRRAHVIASELLAVYPELQQFVDSTAATRLNGWLGGWGTDEEIERELPRMGLSEEAAKELWRRVRNVR